MTDPFWKDHIEILWSKHRLVEFTPTADMNVDEKLNALTRFVVYFGVLLTVIFSSVSYLYIPLIGMVLIYLIHEHYPDLVQKGGSPFVRPTPNNPFMNVLITDYVENPARGPADDVENPAVKKEIEQHYGTGLYRDVDDIWDNRNSQRQYYSMPSSTIPNDRENFMNWCWKTPNTCKDGNLTRCLRYDDVRQHGL